MLHILLLHKKKKKPIEWNVVNAHTTICGFLSGFDFFEWNYQFFIEGKKKNFLFAAIKPFFFFTFDLTALSDLFYNWNPGSFVLFSLKLSQTWTQCTQQVLEYKNPCRFIIFFLFSSKWALSIVSCSPHIQIGDKLMVKLEGLRSYAVGGIFLDCSTCHLLNPGPRVP